MTSFAHLFESPGGGRMQALTVMFTDMADSTEFAERHGSRAALQKRQRHNRLLQPVLTAHGGTLVEMAGDAMLAIFESVADAARCAIAMQRRLADFNRSDELEMEDEEIHIRIGLHYGKAVVVRHEGGVEVAGRAVNVAARVESGNGRQTDQILLSEVARAHLNDVHEEFALEPLGSIEARGVGRLAIYRMAWEQGEVAAKRPLKLLAAKSNPEPRLQLGQTVHAVFVDDAVDRGHVLPVRVHLASGPAGVHSRVNCDRIMEAAAHSAIRAAGLALDRLGFPQAKLSERSIEWWIDGPKIRYEGASLGLAVALAAVAAWADVEADPEIAVTGSIDDERMVRVAGIERKWQALREAGRFHTLVLPAANLADLPAELRHDPRLRLIGVPTVDAAVREVLGLALGLTATRPMASRELIARPTIRLWATSDHGDAADAWRTGDRLRIGVEVDRDCHITLVHRDSDGRATVLLPNRYRPTCFVRAGEVARFPGSNDSYHFEVHGPPGEIALLALASREPLQLPAICRDAAFASSELIGQAEFGAMIR